MSKTAAILTFALLGTVACNAPDAAWESTFTEEELRTAVFNDSKSGDNCPFAKLAGDREAEIRAICADDMEKMRQGFEFELIECTPDLPDYTGLSGPDLRSAEVCLVKYKHIENPATAREYAKAEAEGRTLLGQRIIPTEVRRSWIVYRIDGVPTLHKYLN